MRWMIGLLVMVAVFGGGCESLRFAPGEVQKENAYLHHRTAQMAAAEARREPVSPKLAGLTSLCELQSRAFMADYGLPEELPAAETIEDVLAESSLGIAAAAIVRSSERPDVWDVTDGLLEIGLAVAGIIGGVYGIRASRFFRRAREKSNALREIIEGNELLKQTSSEAAAAFKTAHKAQSPQTRQIVAELKG
ncbi:MAG TPA: hypothetical protein ENH62_16770 [Marinobacter sp.]|uniref:Lipoprotein n=1 Tax=marine sediment metagenome TaxID=412755 RepID=A0A0F9N895_9ZZZZ|nr:hypothetical protein [Marinobacter sp.]